MDVERKKSERRFILSVFQAHCNWLFSELPHLTRLWIGCKPSQSMGTLAWHSQAHPYASISCRQLVWTVPTVSANVHTSRIIYTTKGDACVCVSVCKVWPISARTLSFRQQTSRNFFSHSNFPPLFAFVLCVLRQKIIKQPKMLGKRIDRRNRWSAQREEMNATLYCRLITRWRHGFLL